MLTSQEDLSDFLEYFQKEYAKRIEQWAPRYHIATVVNTNMAVESFHHVLKACYMRDKIFDRAIKLTDFVR